MQMAETKDLEIPPSFSTLALILQLIDKLELSYSNDNSPKKSLPGARLDQLFIAQSHKERR